MDKKRAFCTNSAISVFRIIPRGFDVQNACASFDVQLNWNFPQTTHELEVDSLFERYPDLRRHRCHSGRHRSFYDEARQTETAHLLEHLAVELLVQSGVSRSKAAGKTGIPRDNNRAYYRLNFYGTSSLEQMDVLLHQAADILEELIFARHL